MVQCLDCGFIGQPEQRKPGTLGLEVVLWVLFLVPGVIYTFWRRAGRYSGCAQCGSRRLAPADAAVKQTPLGKLTPTPSAQAWFCEACGKPIFDGGRFCAGCRANEGGASQIQR